MNHDWDLAPGEQDNPHVYMYLCKNCGLYKQVIEKEYVNGLANYKRFVERFGGDIVYWNGKIDYTRVEPSCAELIMREIME